MTNCDNIKYFGYDVKNVIEQKDICRGEIYLFELTVDFIKDHGVICFIG